MSDSRGRLNRTADLSHKRITKAPISSAKLIDITMRNSFPITPSSKQAKRDFSRTAEPSGEAMVGKHSLITCPIAAYPASTQAEKTHYHKITVKLDCDDGAGAPSTLTFNRFQRRPFLLISIPPTRLIDLGPEPA
jgi:hypothetical protein